MNKKKKFSESVQGHVTAIITGRLVEPFLNRCIREGIKIWDISRVEEDRMRCSILLSDIKRIKPILKQTDCRIHFEERVGFPFWTRRLIKRSGMIGGLLLFFFVLFILSNMVWRIQIKGADPVLEHNIRNILSKSDIHIGSINFLLPSLGSIEDQLSSQLKEVTWVGVSRDGTTYRIDVVQKEQPKENEKTGPRDLIATKTATILSMYVENGQAVVKKDDVVKKGQLLVSGMLGDEAHHQFVPAKGKVMGETWYTSKTTVPLNTTYKTFTGKTYVKRQIKAWNFTIPIWGFKKQPFQKQGIETVSHPFHFIIWDLPITFQRVTYKQASEIKHGLSQEEAQTIGEEMARKQLMRKLPTDAQILTEKIQQKSVQNGILNLQIFFTVEEDIAKPRPFATQDREQQIDEQTKKKQEQGQ